MRRLVLTFSAAVATMLGAAPALSHPSGGEVIIKAHAYSPNPETVTQRNTVIWFWDGPDTDHSVTSDEDSPLEFDSDPGKAPGEIRHEEGSAFGVRFTEPGTYRYHCKVYPDMRGEIQVTPSTVTPGGTTGDTRAPRVDFLEATAAGACVKRSRTCRRPGVKFGFELSEQADLAVRVERLRRGRRPVEVRGFLVRRGGGRGTLRLGPKGLRPGVHRLVVVATDTSGNRARPARISFRVRAS